MPDDSDNAQSPIQEFVSWTTTGQTEHPFYAYEPWDGPDGEAPRYTPGGARFQLSCLRSTKYIRLSLAGNQIGKTYDRAAEAVIMMTGELPYCFRFQEGVDTGVKRVISKNNIRRWGRIDTLSGQILDHNHEHIRDGTWNCGNIVGVGPYPKEKICNDPDSKQLWICSYKQARDDTWIDLVAEMIPAHCLDKSQGTDGYSLSKFIFYLTGGKSIRLKTYEQGWEKTESQKAWHIVLDEEPPVRKYYTGCIMHAHSLSLSYTPLRGMSWSYTDLYQNWLDGSEDIEVFHATKYDCPFTTDEEVEREERQLKGWEREPKIYGNYGQQEGRPYYDYELCSKYLQDYAPSYKLARILPTEAAATVRDSLKSNIIKIPADEVKPDTWQIYEDRKPGVAYWQGTDCAMGSDDPEVAQDFSISYIARAPIEEDGEDPDWPVCVAALRSSDVTENFARLCLYAAIYYNYALLIPETKGEDGRAFQVEIRDYPFWFTMNVMNQKTRKPTEKIGFDTSKGTRTPLFNKLRKYVNAHEDRSYLPHYELLVEMSKIIWLKGRPDHPPNGKSDCVVAWCLVLWAWEEARTQIRDNSRLFGRNQEEKNVKEILSGLTKRPRSETRPVLGTSRGIDSRSRERWQQRQKENSRSRQQRSQRTIR